MCGQYRQKKANYSGYGQLSDICQTALLTQLTQFSVIYDMSDKSKNCEIKIQMLFFILLFRFLHHS